MVKDSPREGNRFMLHSYFGSCSGCASLQRVNQRVTLPMFALPFSGTKNFEIVPLYFDVPHSRLRTPYPETALRDVIELSLNSC